MLTPDDVMKCENALRKYSHSRSYRIEEISYVPRTPGVPLVLAPKEFLNECQGGDFRNFLSVIFSMMDGDK